MQHSRLKNFKKKKNVILNNVVRVNQIRKKMIVIVKVVRIKVRIREVLQQKYLIEFEKSLQTREKSLQEALIAMNDGGPIFTSSPMIESLKEKLTEKQPKITNLN